MGLVSVHAAYFLVRKVLHTVVFITIVLVRRLLYKVSYALIITSIVRKTCVDNIMS